MEICPKFPLQIQLPDAFAVHIAILVMAVVVGVRAAISPRRASREETFTREAEYSSPQREERVIAIMLHRALHLARFHEIDAEIFLFGNHGRMKTVLVFPGKRIREDSRVELEVFAQDAINELQGGLPATRRGEPPMVKEFHQFDLRAKPLGVMLQSLLNDGEYFFIRRIG